MPLFYLSLDYLFSVGPPLPLESVSVCYLRRVSKTCTLDYRQLEEREEERESRREMCTFSLTTAEGMA